MPTVLITGASRGLGLEFARQYTAEHWRVIATCRDPARADDLNALDLEVLGLDVTNASSIAALAARLLGEPLDLLINNAGLMGEGGAPHGPRQSIGNMDFHGWQEVLDVNLLGPFRVTQALLPNLEHAAEPNRPARIVVLSSQLGSIADNTSGGLYAYRTAKAGANMVVRGLAVDLEEQNILVAALNPGWVRTDMGGIQAPTLAHESVAAMRRVIETLDRDSSGKLLDLQGHAVSW